MKRLLVAVFVGCIGFVGQTAFAQDASVNKDGIGPFGASMTIQSNTDTAKLHLSVRNDSGQTIEFVRFCVRAAGTRDGCDFQLWTDRPWKPREKLTWDSTAPATAGIENSNISIAELKTTPSPLAPAAPALKPDPKFEGVGKIFVDAIDGSSGAMAREQLIALIVNSGRFEAVEDPKLAEATIKGRSEVIEVGAKSIATIVAKGSIFIPFKAQDGDGSTYSEALVIRLTTTKGEIIWAWDNTKLCRQTKTRCAIDDLVATALGRLPPSLLSHNNR